MTQESHPVPPPVCIVAHKDYADGGGATRAAFNLLSSQEAVQPATSLLVKTKATKHPKVITYAPPRALGERIRRRLLGRTLRQRFGVFSKAFEAKRDFLLLPAHTDTRTLADQVPPGAIVNLHWVAGFVDFTTFFDRLPKPRRLVWTLHDTAAFTGGCHYSEHCRRFEQSCGACFQIGSNDEQDATRLNWEIKQRAYASLADSELTIVSPSQWLAAEARKSALLGRFPVEVIPYGVDSDTFAPRDRAACRKALGIPEDKLVIGFIAYNVNSPRKGIDIVTAAFRDPALVRDCFLVTAGSGKPSLPEGIGSVHLGKIESDRLLTMFYSCVDAFIIASREDNLPNVVLESLACGTPVIGSRTGGIPDMIREGETGWTFDKASPEDLRRVLLDLLPQRERVQAMRPACRKAIEEGYTLQLQADRYARLFQRIAAR